MGSQSTRNNPHHERNTSQEVDPQFEMGIYIWAVYTGLVVRGFVSSKCL